MASWMGGGKEVFFMVTCYTEDGVRVSPCYHYLLHGVKGPMLPVTFAIASDHLLLLVCYSIKVRFWQCYKAKTGHFWGEGG